MRFDRPVILDEAKYVYPLIASPSSKVSFTDEFNRETLNTTNAYVLYTTAANGAGTGTIVNGLSWFILTGAVIGNDVDSRVSGMLFERLSIFDNSRTIIEIDVIFANSELTNYEMFIGLYGTSQGQINTIPAAGDLFFGLEVDRSASANYRFIGGNDTDKAVTDSSVAVDQADHRFNIIWSGDDTAILTLYGGANLDTVQATTTLTSLNSDEVAYTLHFFLQTEEAQVKTLQIKKWRHVSR